MTADVKFEVKQAALTTAAATNTQDITISGFGTPKAAILIASNGVTDATAASTAKCSIGFTDGTRTRSGGCVDTNGGGTSDSRQWQSTNMLLFKDAANNVIAEFSVAIITDGIRLTVVDQAPSAYLATVILIGGTDVSNVRVDSKDMVSASTVDITDPGFQPDLVLFAGVSAANFPGGNTTASLYFGACHNDGSDTQRCVAIYGLDNQTTSDNAGAVYNTKCAAYLGSAANWETSCGSFDSSGFSLTTSTTAGPPEIGYLALKFTNTPDISLFDFSYPTSGNYAETAPGFTPNFGILAAVSGVGSRNTNDTTGVYGFSIAAFDGSSIATIATQSKDAATSMVANSMASDSLVTMQPDSSSVDVAASSYAFDADGWDFTLSTNPGSAVLGWGLAIGPAGGAVSVSPMGHQRLDNQYSAIAASRLNGVLQ